MKKFLIGLLLICFTGVSVYANPINFTEVLDEQVGIPVSELDAFKAAYPAGTTFWPEAIETGDITGDGKDDLIISCHNGRGLVFKRKADGFAFESWTDTITNGVRTTRSGLLSTDINSNYRPYLLDLNGDNKIDFCNSGSSIPGKIFFNNGEKLVVGPNSPSSTKGDMDRAKWLDLNGDTLPDYTGYARGSIATPFYKVKLTNELTSSTPKFTTTLIEMLPREDFPQDVVDKMNQFKADTNSNNRYAGPRILDYDINNDGLMDTVVAYGGGYAYGSYRWMKVLIRQADGTLVNKTAELGLFENTYPTLIADVNGDNLLDFFCAHGGVNAGMYLQRANGTFFSYNTEMSQWLNYTQDYTPEVRLVDFNGDGTQDIFISTMRAKSARIYQNNNNTTFSKVLMYYDNTKTPPKPLYDIYHADAEGWKITDIDKDGDYDLVTLTPTPRIRFFINNFKTGNQTEPEPQTPVYVKKLLINNVEQTITGLQIEIDGVVQDLTNKNVTVKANQ